MCNFGLNGGILWLSGTNGAFCFISENKGENVTHCFFVCANFCDKFNHFKVDREACYCAFFLRINFIKIVLLLL